jgi:hypothetical protein
MKGITPTLVIGALLATATLTGCGKKDPCIKEWGCEDCDCLFDRYQASQHDPARAAQIQECYRKACE